MNRVQKYNKVLGLKGSVNMEELKKLYREKAKVLHPDRSNNKASHDDFILLGEAYEFYKQMLTQAEERKREEFFKSKKYPERYYNEKWNVEKRKAARKKAAERAKMKYEMFEKKGYYKRLDRLFYVMDVIRFLAAIAMLSVFPIFMFFQDQFRGLIIALFVQFITYRLWSGAIKRFIGR